MAKDSGRGWGTLAALVAALGMCAMPTHGQVTGYPMTNANIRGAVRECAAESRVGPATTFNDCSLTSALNSWVDDGTNTGVDVDTKCSYSDRSRRAACSNGNVGSCGQLTLSECYAECSASESCAYFSYLDPDPSTTCLLCKSLPDEPWSGAGLDHSFV